MVCIYRRQNSTQKKTTTVFSERTRARACLRHRIFRCGKTWASTKLCAFTQLHTKPTIEQERESERASESFQCKRHASQYTSTIHRQSAIQREKKKCEKQSGPKSFAYNSRYNNNNNNRTAAELKYQIYLNVRRICCAMCYVLCIHIGGQGNQTHYPSNESKHKWSSQSNQRTNERTYQLNNLTAKPMEHEIYRNHSNMCEHSGKKKKTKTVLIHQMTNFYQF